MNIFYCDIVGTITNGDMKDLVVCLNKIIERDELDCLYFSFVTSNDIKDLKEYLSKLYPLIVNTKIKFNTHFCENYQIETDGRIINNNLNCKVDQIRKDIENKNIKSIYYADDQKMNVCLISHIIDIKRSEIYFKTFTPGTFFNDENSYGSGINGLDGLIESINNYCLQKKLHKK